MAKPTEPPVRDDTGKTGSEFVSRWSRRKSAARRAGGPGDALAPSLDDPVDDPVDDPRTATPHDSGSHAGTDSAASGATDPTRAPDHLSDADMPALETLEEGSDFSGFLSPKVSQELRRAALRKLWSQARFNVVDGLNDYDDDFTILEPLGDIVTSDMRFGEEQRAQREAGERERREQQAAIDAEREQQRVAQEAADETSDAVSDHERLAQAEKPDDARTQEPVAQQPAEDPLHAERAEQQLIDGDDGVAEPASKARTDEQNAARDEAGVGDADSGEHSDERSARDDR